MRVVIAPPRLEYQALVLMLQRGLLAALAPHPFAPAQGMVAPKRCDPPSMRH